MLFVPYLRKNFLSVSTLEHDRYVILHLEGQVIMYPIKEGMGAARMLDIKDTTTYRVLGHLVDGEFGGRPESVETTMESSGEDSSSSVRRPS